MFCLAPLRLFTTGEKNDSRTKEKIVQKPFYQAGAKFTKVMAVLLLGVSQGWAETVVRDPLGPRPIAESYFSLNVRWGATTPYWPPVRFHSWRVITGETSWYSLEPVKGMWQFLALDRAVDRAENKQVEVLYTLGYPAKWATDPKLVSVWNPGIALPPSDMADWEEYVRRVAERYKGRIKYYELMNEPHFSEVDRPYSKVDFPVATMVEMARIASRVIKQIDPEAKLVSMSPSGRLNGVRRVDAFLKAGGGQYIDAVSFHFYSESPEHIPELVSALRKVLASNGQSRLDIWNTESGFYIAGPDKPHGVGGIPKNETLYTPEQGGAMVARALTLGAAAGLRRFYWYSWDIPSMALTEGKGKVIAPAGNAYIKTGRWLRGATINECRTADDKLWICTLNRGTRQAHLVWNTSGARNWMAPAQWRARQYETLLSGMANVDQSGRIRVDETPLLIVSDDLAWGTP